MKTRETSGQTTAGEGLGMMVNHDVICSALRVAVRRLLNNCSLRHYSGLAADPGKCTMSRRAARAYWLIFARLVPPAKLIPIRFLFCAIT